MQRAAIIYNPVSGAGRAEALALRAEERLQGAGATVVRLPTQGPGQAEPLARAHAADIDLLVVAGGDGSIREALSGLGEQSARVEVAVLPCGNANVVARELGIPLDPEAALALLTEGRSQPVDLARADGELFLAMVGVGWDARTVRHLSRLRATRFGRFWYRLWADSVYVLAGLLALFVRPGGRLRVLADGADAGRRYCAAVVANFRCYGKGWAMVTDARCDSGRLHYQARKRAGFLFVAWQLLSAMWRRPLPAFVSDGGAGRCVELSADRPFAVQIDGDAREPRSHLRVDVYPAAARFRVPSTGGPAALALGA